MYVHVNALEISFENALLMIPNLNRAVYFCQKIKVFGIRFLIQKLSDSDETVPPALFHWQSLLEL